MTARLLRTQSAIGVILAVALVLTIARHNHPAEGLLLGLMAFWTILGGTTYRALRRSAPAARDGRWLAGLAAAVFILAAILMLLQH